MIEFLCMFTLTFNGFRLRSSEHYCYSAASSAASQTLPGVGLLTWAALQSEATYGKFHLFDLFEDTTIISFWVFQKKKKSDGYLLCLHVCILH